MGIGISIVLMAAGAILRFAVETSVHNINAGMVHLHAVDVHMVGNILMAAGIAGLLLSLLVLASRSGSRGDREGAMVERERHA